MLHNTAFLLGHVKAAIAATEGGLIYAANDGSGLWGVSTQVAGDVSTGKIIVGCVDDDVLGELKTNLQHHGHQVEDGRSQTTGNVVPGTIVITPGD